MACTWRSMAGFAGLWIWWRWRRQAVRGGDGESWRLTFVGQHGGDIAIGVNNAPPRAPAAKASWQTRACKYRSNIDAHRGASRRTLLSAFRENAQRCASKA